MQFPFFGHRRLQISVRVDRVVSRQTDLAELHQDWRAREQALAQRARWEQEVVTQIGWLK